jgi:hypothetical protein
MREGQSRARATAPAVAAGLSAERRGAEGALQRFADLSPATTRLRALQAVADTAGVTQRDKKKKDGEKPKEKRSNNPHNLHTGTTAHHIIPHELMTNIFGKFDAAEKEDIGRSFLPDFDTLTMANFVAQVAVGVEYAGDSPKKIDGLPPGVRHKTFGALTDEERGKAYFKVEGAGRVDFARFREIYEAKKDGTLDEDPDDGISGLRDIGESFFEWQGGNLFYGPERIEPGKKDGFDHDASLVFGDTFTNSLKAIYDRLRALEDAGPEAKPQMQAALGDLAALTRNAAVPRYTPSLWIAVDSPLKKRLHDEMLPERHHTSKMDASIHRSELREAIRRYAPRQKRVAHDMLVAQRQGGGTAGMFTVAKRHITFTDDASGKAALPAEPRLKIADFTAAIEDAMLALFKLV